MAGYYGFTLVVLVFVRLYVRPHVRPYFRFRMITNECQWILTKLSVCNGIVEIWVRIANGKFRQFLTELSGHDKSFFSSQDDNLRANMNGFSPNVVCALILLRSDLGLLMGKFL